MSDIEKALDKVFDHEGGYQKLPNDSGNYTSSGKLIGTNYGISAKVLSNQLGREATEKDMQALTEDEARDIYKKEYIHPVTKNLGISPDSVIFEQVLDMVINHGYGNTVPIVQRAAGTSVDGKSGPGTRKAIKQAGDITGALVDKRKDFYEAAVRSDSRKQEFLKGWLDRAESFR